MLTKDYIERGKKYVVDTYGYLVFHPVERQMDNLIQIHTIDMFTALGFNEFWDCDESEALLSVEEQITELLQLLNSLTCLNIGRDELETKSMYEKIKEFAFPLIGKQKGSTDGKEKEE
jgi:hypothetical protein